MSAGPWIDLPAVTQSCKALENDCIARVNKHTEQEQNHAGDEKCNANVVKLE